jgi:phosphatidylserine decarboxylase
MSILDSMRSQLVPVHREGYPFIAAFAVVALILFLLWQPLGWLGAIMTAWCAYFFRDPPRITPTRDGLVVAPADGVVSRVLPAVPPKELDLGDAPLPRISIFMSVFDCHVNRSPVAGRIARIVYRAGKFINADLDKASEDNERQHILVEGEDGTLVAFTQIAGLVARRIVPWIKAGDRVIAGQRIGLIRFGSRVDVYLPAGTSSQVLLGQRTIAGETIVGRIGVSELIEGIAQ